MMYITRLAGRKWVIIINGLKLVKSKFPESIIFTRNEDGTYQIKYTGMMFTYKNEVIGDGMVDVPRCKLSWDNSGSIPRPLIEEMLKGDDENGMLFTFLVTENPSINKSNVICPECGKKM